MKQQIKDFLDSELYDGFGWGVGISAIIFSPVAFLQFLGFTVITIKVITIIVKRKAEREL